MRDTVKKINRSHTHTHTPTENNTPDTDTHIHDTKKQKGRKWWTSSNTQRGRCLSIDKWYLYRDRCRYECIDMAGRQLRRAFGADEISARREEVKRLTGHTHTHTDREQHPRHRHTQTRQETEKKEVRTVQYKLNTGTYSQKQRNTTLTLAHAQTIHYTSN